MEEAPPDGENVSSDSSKELDPDEGTPRHRHSDSISQAEEGEDREELIGEPAEELAGEPAEPAEPAEGAAEETIVGCPTLGQESPLRSVRESEERVVVHTSEEIDCLC